MVSAAEINRNVSPHYATTRDFLIAAVLVAHLVTVIDFKE